MAFVSLLQVFVAAIAKRKQVCPSNLEILHENRNASANRIGIDASSNTGILLYTNKLRCALITHNCF